MSLLYPEESYKINGALYEVHKELGPGLNEYCYQEGMESQLKEQGIIFEREKKFHPIYHDKPLNAEYRLDFLCKNDIILECKAVSELTSAHRAQLFNYMRLTKLPCGILVNFIPRFATIERYFLNLENMDIIGTDGKVKQFL